MVSAVHGFVGPRGISPRTVDRDGNANLTDAAKAAGADLVLMSVVGAAPDSPMELFRMKHAAEQHAAASGIPATIVGATAFMELWIDLLRQTAGRSGRALVFGHGDSPINFVSVTDVASLVEQVVTDPKSRGETVEIGGPENLTFNELARAVQAADGRTGPPRHIPPTALRLMANTVGRVRAQVGRQARAALAMDSGDHTFDTSALRRRYPGTTDNAAHRQAPRPHLSVRLSIEYVTESTRRACRPQKNVRMSFAVVNHVRILNADRAAAATRDVVLPRLRQLPGFEQAIFLAEGETGRGFSVMVFATQDQADEMADRLRAGQVPEPDGIAFERQEVWEVTASS